MLNMAISEKNRRYRKLEMLVADAACVLNSQLAYGTKYAALDDICKEWTQFNGKYRGCARWTKFAMMHYCLGYKRGLRGKLLVQGLVHEHVVPRKVIITEFLDKLQPPTPESVRQIFGKFLIGVVVAKVEDEMLNVYYRDRMPDEFLLDSTSPEYHDPFLRYKRCRNARELLGNAAGSLDLDVEGALEILDPPNEWWLDMSGILNSPSANGQESAALPQ